MSVNHHGRVRFSSWTPEILPIQAPARARTCRCMALPARLRKSSGVVVVPLLVTFVSVFM